MIFQKYLSVSYLIILTLDEGRYHIETSPLIWRVPMECFLYDKDLRHERVDDKLYAHSWD